MISPEELKKYKTYRTIGVPKETAPDELRVSLIPKTIVKLRRLGFAVKVEKGAGERAGILDNDYEMAGAEVVSEDEVWKCEMVLKIREPLTKEESAKAKNTKLLVCGIDPAFHKDAMTQLKMNENLIVWYIRCFPRITRPQKPVTLSLFLQKLRLTL